MTVNGGYTSNYLKINCKELKYYQNKGSINDKKKHQNYHTAIRLLGF